MILTFFQRKISCLQLIFGAPLSWDTTEGVSFPCNSYLEHKCPVVVAGFISCFIFKFNPGIWGKKVGKTNLVSLRRFKPKYKLFKVLAISHKTGSISNSMCQKPTKYFQKLYFNCLVFYQNLRFFIKILCFSLKLPGISEISENSISYLIVVDKLVL